MRTWNTRQYPPRRFRASHAAAHHAASHTTNHNNDTIKTHQCTTHTTFYSRTHTDDEYVHATCNSNASRANAVDGCPITYLFLSTHHRRGSVDIAWLRGAPARRGSHGHDVTQELRHQEEGDRGGSQAGEDAPRRALAGNRLLTSP